MTESIILLAITAASIGFIHTFTGPDHYIPFIVMAKARKWGYIKTIWITILCGIGHVGSSVVIGLIGVATGLAVAKINFIEGYRGNVAAWLFILFGFVYLIWGLWKAYKNKPHKHFHVHESNEISLHKHLHEHSHDGVTHQHSHKEEKKTNITPWILFTVFVLGPCEPLIPLMMYPAAQKSFSGMLIIILVFFLCTVITMITMVLTSLFGFSFIPMHKIDRYMHAIAGGSIFLCGLGIVLLDL